MSTAQDRPGSGAMLNGGAVVVWSGDLKSGTGRLRFESGAGGELALLWPGSDGYGPGATTPEELTAAAHAACFTMTLAYTLARNGHRTRKITATARATFGIADHVRVIQDSQLRHHRRSGPVGRAGADPGGGVGRTLLPGLVIAMASGRARCFLAASMAFRRSSSRSGCRARRGWRAGGESRRARRTAATCARRPERRRARAARGGRAREVVAGDEVVAGKDVQPPSPAQTRILGRPAPDSAQS